MSNCLIGYTGLVGTNLRESMSFDFSYNSKNIEDIRGKKFNTVICAGARGTKWKANARPRDDWDSIKKLIGLLETVKAERMVLISTIDVYNMPRGVSEADIPSRSNIHSYGEHRLLFEQFVKNTFSIHHIVRLPIIFGLGLKKNMIFDLMNMHRIDFLDPGRTVQIYDLADLADDITKVIDNDIRISNFATEPMTVAEVARDCFDVFLPPRTSYPFYDMKTIHDKLFSGRDGYMYSSSNMKQKIIDYRHKQLEVSE